MTPSHATHHRHALDYLVAIHHLAWLVAADAHEVGEESAPVHACGTIADLSDHWNPGPDDPRPYLRAAADLLDLACADGATEAGPLADTARRLLEGHHVD